MKHKITVARSGKHLGHLNSGRLIKRAIASALSYEGIDDPCYISVMLTDDDGIRTYNREYRNVDRSTDVLSFPMNELKPGSFEPGMCEKDPETGRILLGDMMINLNRCDEQGKEFGHGFGREIAYLSVHSTLHLLGYDHVDEGEMKKQMRDREKTIMGDK